MTEGIKEILKMVESLSGSRAGEGDSDEHVALLSVCTRVIECYFTRSKAVKH